MARSRGESQKELNVSSFRTRHIQNGSSPEEPGDIDSKSRQVRSPLNLLLVVEEGRRGVGSKDRDGPESWVHDPPPGGLPS